MRVLRFRAYYYPEVTSSNHLSDDVDNALRNEKITYVNYTPTPTRGISDEMRKEYKNKKYEQSEDGYVIIHRFSMIKEGKNPIQRAFRYLLCNIAQYYKGINAKDIDLVYSASTPPTMGLISAMVSRRLSKKGKRKVPFVYNLQDIFPDSLVTTGLTKKGSLIWKIGRKIEDYTYNNADKIIVISESMKRNILEKGVPSDKIVVVSNWIDLEETKPVKKSDNRLYDKFSIPRDKFTVLYAGNFGAAQGADVILKCAQRLKDHDDIQFVIFGGGSGFEAAKAEVEQNGLKNVIINSLLPPDRVSEVYSLGDVALITCKKGVGGSGMPSKTWSIMACNTPIIASFDTDSELAEVIENANAGVCVEPENADELAKAILAMFSNAEESKDCNCRDYVALNASKDVCVAKYVETLKQACGLKQNEEKEDEYAALG